MSWELTLRRILAYVLDILLLFVVLAPLAILFESMLELRPETGFQIWIAIVVSFSVPVWTYFILSDTSQTGATLGKRIMNVAVRRSDGTSRLTFDRALARTALKLLPWELAHIFGFALVDVLGEQIQAWGLVLANLLTAAYLIICIATGGEKSLHDHVVDTSVVR